MFASTEAADEAEAAGEIQYIHIQTDSGGVTLAVHRDMDHPQIFAVGAAFRSPEESWIKRKKGRNIALGRLRAGGNGTMTHIRHTKAPVLRNLADSPADMLSVLRCLETRPHGKLGLPGPLWWAGFLKAVRRKFAAERIAKERPDEALYCK